MLGVASTAPLSIEWNYCGQNFRKWIIDGANRICLTDLAKVVSQPVHCFERFVNGGLHQLFRDIPAEIAAAATHVLIDVAGGEVVDHHAVSDSV